MRLTKNRCDHNLTGLLLLQLHNNLCIFWIRLKNDHFNPDLFRKSDPRNVTEEDDQQMVELVPEVKAEPVIDSAQSTESVNSTEGGPSRTPNFLQVKSKEVFDYEPTASSIHASLWPHWWLKAVQSRYKLRKTEGKKNEKLLKGLQHLFKEALEVGTI